MLKGANATVGDRVAFTIEQDFDQKSRDSPMSKEFRKMLLDHDVHVAFKSLIPSKRKEILRYMAHLKTPEAKMRNMEKVILNLKQL